MTAVNVTLTTSATTHYWIAPEATITAATANDINVPDTLMGFVSNGAIGNGVYGSDDNLFSDAWPTTLTFPLDDSVLWDLNITFRGAPPIVFQGLNVSGGGDLITLLEAQGWTPL